MKIAGSWLESGETAHQRLGAQVVGMFAEAVDESYLRKNFDDLLRILTEKIDDSIRDFDVSFVFSFFSLFFFI